jgi:hypothetical protein
MTQLNLPTAKAGGSEGNHRRLSPALATPLGVRYSIRGVGSQLFTTRPPYPPG